MVDLPQFDAHLFICTNRKAEGKASCAPKGSEALRDRVKEAAAKHSTQHPGRKIRVNASGCLGQCSQGIAAVCYPGAQWFLELSDDAASEKKCLEALFK
jgi:predicted metal-binding protein